MKPTIPEVLARFAAYHAKHPTWGSLHIVLDDSNTDRGSVEFCVGWAKKHGDPEGAALAEILLEMSESQRRRLPDKVKDEERKIT